MDRKTILALCALNRRFYATRAGEFDHKRSGAWPGWERVVAALPQRPVRVLDVGCGNGRLARYLLGRASVPVSLLGIDSCAALLERARAGTPAGADVRYVEGDVLAQADLTLPAAVRDAAPFDLVALFGFLHHVPGADTRRRLLARLADALAPGGLLAVSLWRFGGERFARKQVDWRDAAVPGVDLAALEPGDHLLAWGEGGDAVRYCHLIDEAEEARLVAGLPLLPVAAFDGEDGLNRYVLLTRPAATSATSCA